MSYKILAAVNVDVRSYAAKMSLLSLFPHKPLRTELLVDSKARFETLTTLHSSEDYRLRAIIARMRASFESMGLNAVRWIPGVKNVADALTKRNVKRSQHLIDMVVAGLWNVDVCGGCVLNSETWI